MNLSGIPLNYVPPKSVKLDDQEWPYLAKIRELSRHFSTLQQLVHWVEVSYQDEIRPRKRYFKPNNVHITLFEPGKGTTPTATDIKSVDELKAILTSTTTPTIQPVLNDHETLTLFLVEDLSSQIMELLGSRFDVDPFCFREHIESSRPYNTITPDVTARKKCRQWFSVQSERALFSLSEPCSTGIVVVTASSPDRTTIWMGRDRKRHDAPVGIVLINSGVDSRSSYWYRCTQWPLTHMETTLTPPALDMWRSWYGAIVEMTRTSPWFDTSVSHNALDPRIVVYPVIYQVCGEWLSICKWANKYLIEVELRLDNHKFSFDRRARINEALRSLQFLRLKVPAWMEMVTEMLEDSLPTALRLTAQSTPDETAENVLCDMKGILRTLQGLQARSDRLQERSTAELQLEAARESLAESHNLARLSWLATIFIPLTFISGLFSMTDNVHAIKGTFKTYLSAAIPLTVGVVIMAKWGPLSLLRSIWDWLRQAKAILHVLFFFFTFVPLHESRDTNNV